MNQGHISSGIENVGQLHRVCAAHYVKGRLYADGVFQVNSHIVADLFVVNVTHAGIITLTPNPHSAVSHRVDDLS